MRRKLIKKLAEQSYSKNDLDETKVKKIAKSLKREDLRVYIKDLKNIENRRTVQVWIPNDSGKDEIKQNMEKIYPGRKIQFEIDPTLLAGIRVVDYDNIYELTFKNSFENILEAVVRND